MGLVDKRSSCIRHIVAVVTALPGWHEIYPARQGARVFSGCPLLRVPVTMKSVAQGCAAFLDRGTLPRRFRDGERAARHRAGRQPLQRGGGPGHAADRVVCPGWPRSFTCLAVLFTAVVLTSGCTSWREYVHNGFKVGPNYRKPPAPVAKDWIDADDQRVRTAVRRPEQMVDGLQRPGARFPDLLRLPAEPVAARGGDASAASAGPARHRRGESVAANANSHRGLQVERAQQANGQQLSAV